MVKIETELSKADPNEIILSSPKKTKENYFINGSITVDDKPQEFLVQLKGNIYVKSVENGKLSLNINEKDINEFIVRTENTLLSKCKEQKEEWFPDKGFTDASLDDAFLSSFKPLGNDNIVFKPILSKSVCVYNNLKESINVEELEENSNVGLILCVAGLWFTKTRFGVTWKVKQIKVKTLTKMIKKCMIEDSDDEEDIDENIPSNVD